MNSLLKHLFYTFFLITLFVFSEVKAGITERTVLDSLDLSQFNVEQKAIITEELKVYTESLDALAVSNLDEWKKKVKVMLVKLKDGFRIYKLARDPEINERVKNFEDGSKAKVYLLTYVEDAFLNNIFSRLAEAYYETSRPSSYLILKFKFIKAAGSTDESPLFQRKDVTVEISKAIVLNIPLNLSQANAVASVGLPANKGISDANLDDGFATSVNDLLNWFDKAGLKGVNETNEINLAPQDINGPGGDLAKGIKEGITAKASGITGLISDVYKYPKPAFDAFSRWLWDPDTPMDIISSMDLIGMSVETGLNVADKIGKGDYFGAGKDLGSAIFDIGLEVGGGALLTQGGKIVGQVRRTTKGFDVVIDQSRLASNGGNIKVTKVKPKDLQKTDGVIKTPIYKNITFDDFAKTIGNATVEQKQIAYKLWGEEKWDELYDLFNPPNGQKINDGWPPYNGIKKIVKTERGSQLAGKTFDRFQAGNNLDGRYASPVFGNEGVDELIFTYDSRALKSSIEEGTIYIKFRIKNTVATSLSFEYGDAVPWWKVQGTADQIKSNIKFSDLKEGIDYEVLQILKYENKSWVKIK